MSVFAVSLSGLMAQAKRLAVSAANVANLRSAGVDPAAPAGSAAASAGGGPAYVPHRVAEVATAGGGVRAVAVPVSPPSVAVFDPGHARADANGIVHLPNVSLERELVDQLIAKRSFQANLRALEAQDELLGRLLDLKS